MLLVDGARDDLHTRAMPVEAKTIEHPDETVAFEHGRVHLVAVGSLTLGYEVQEPGWRWSEHVYEARRGVNEAGTIPTSQAG